MGFAKDSRDLFEKKDPKLQEPLEFLIIHRTPSGYLVASDVATQEEAEARAKDRTQGTGFPRWIARVTHAVQPADVVVVPIARDGT